MDSPANFYDSEVDDTKPKSNNSVFLFDETVLADYSDIYRNEGSIDFSLYLQGTAAANSPSTTVKNDDIYNELDFLPASCNPALTITPTPTDSTLPELIEVNQIESKTSKEDTEYMSQIGENRAPPTSVKTEAQEPEKIVVTIKTEKDASSPSVCQHTYSTSTPETRNRLKSAPASKSLKGKRTIDKNSEEYRHRREKNNVAVRRSREKSKVKQKEVQNKVSQLQDENDKLQKKVELLTKELTVLKSLFTNVGVTPPVLSGSDSM
ncbi:uncharacterized protein LOC100376486 [Saccoglossus kowalevskii]|uniref:CCAAT/enhancer-binding protein delta-like n=1 Tax=Saccoglossus kowalevskii TaxID=10224 RepID=A0ABM0MNX3_SACKO|nr:PREDICTED: CCAAT/enhancer-binding protein delta-like [Saccoglossus kowalevskii]